MCESLPKQFCIPGNTQSCLPLSLPLDLQENFTIATTGATPNAARSPAAHQLMTSTPSPLSVVQPRGSTRRARSISLSPISSTSSSSLHTPLSTSTHLADNVKRLSLSGNSETDARRCLFPELLPPLTSLTHHVSQDSWFYEHDALVGKRINRTRLKRL